MYDAVVGPIADQIEGAIDAIAWERERLGL